MNRFLSLMAVVLTLGLTLGAVDAEAAKRLGGGKSSGMQRQSQAMDKNAATPTPSPAAPAANSMAAAAPAAAAAAAPKRSWMGPIAGLAAGLGLAALASHLGFGEELANFLMMGLLVMAVLAVIALVMRRRAAAQRPALATAGGWNGAGQGSDTAVQRRGYDVALPPAGGSASGSMIGARLAEPAAIPADFDAPAFERQAKVQFIRLQAAGDVGNLDDIRSFTTPEMFAELRMELAERGNQKQHTDVVSVDARVLEVVQEDTRYIVSVRFSGSTRDEGAASAEAFDEIWHLVKPREGGSGWLLAGIQQVQA